MTSRDRIPLQSDDMYEGLHHDFLPRSKGIRLKECDAEIEKLAFDSGDMDLCKQANSLAKSRFF